MDFVSPVLDTFNRLWDCTANNTSYICHLKENLKSLRAVKRRLQNLSEDVKISVEIEERQHRKRTNVVEGWMNTVKRELEAVDIILHEGEQEIQKKRLTRCFIKYCYSSYKIGKKVVEKIDIVQELTRQREDFKQVQVTYALPPPPVAEMLTQTTVGMDSKVDEVWRFIEDPNVRIIGLYGTGGTGKTTLLKKINNKFLDNRSHNFDLVAWTVVSKDVDLEKIQDALRKKLEIPDDAWEKDRAAEISRQLRKKKFILLLDDVWEQIDLSILGVPFDNHTESKIVFTTRSQQVCAQMGTQKEFDMGRLSKGEALELFRLKVGEDVLKANDKIPKLAQLVAEKCKGLPLALVVVGRAMAGRRTPEEWRNAITELRNNPSIFPGMQEQVFSILKFSYDSLNATMKTCFLYCALFLEDFNVPKDDIVKLWIGEGFLNDFDNISDARDKGKSIIESLKLACLLEKSDMPRLFVDPEDFLKMHDVIYDLAIWLASEEGKSVLVAKRVNFNKAKVVADWEKAVRISLWGSEIEFQKEIPLCSRLQTFLLKDTKLNTLPNGFFQSMPLLQVLDLSFNRDLTELPVGIGELTNLQYLNLSDTNVSEFPIEVKNLRRLRMLLLDDMSNLEAIPSRVISCLSSLQAFSRLLGGSNELHYQHFDGVTLLQELESLQDIDEIGVTLFTRDSIFYVMSSPKLASCLKGLTIKCSGLNSLDVSSSVVRRMKNLEVLTVCDCDSLEDIKICFEAEESMRGLRSDGFCNLQEVQVWNCPIKHLTWLIYAPCLQILLLDNCSSLEEIIASDFKSSEIEEESLDLFTKLRCMDLKVLPNLKSICPQAMSFVSLQEIFVDGCPSLRKLPFKSSSANTNLNTICGSTEWWEQLEWEDETIRHALSSKFLSLGELLLATVSK